MLPRRANACIVIGQDFWQNLTSFKFQEQNIKSLIRHIFSSVVKEIEPKEWNLFDQEVHRINLQKEQFFLEAGQVAENFAMVVSGCLRIYYITVNGQETNQAFKMENELASGYASLITGEPCRFYIQALEPTVLEVFPFVSMRKHFDRHKGWERLGRLVAEEHFVTKELREEQFLLLNARERYLQLLQKKPEILERVPQYHIASFLGVTPSSLNRLIKAENLPK